MATTTAPGIITTKTTVAATSKPATTTAAQATTTVRTIGSTTTAVNLTTTSVIHTTSTTISSSSHTTTNKSASSTTTTTTTSISTGNAIGESSSGNGMSTGGIVGVVIAIILVFIGSIVGGFFLLKQRRKRLMLVGKNSRNYNGYPEPDLDKPKAPFRREGRPSSGYISNSGYGVLPPGGNGLHSESGIYNDKSLYADAAGLGGPRMSQSGFGSTRSIGGESYTQMSNGMFVPTGRHNGDASPTSPLSPGDGSRTESGKNLRASRTDSVDLNPEQLERERQLDLQQQARLLSMAGGEGGGPISPPLPPLPSSNSPSSPTFAGPYPYPRPMNQAAFRGPSGDVPPIPQRPTSYYSQPYGPNGGYQYQQYPQGGPRPQTEFYPQQQHPYPQYPSGSQDMRPMAQFQPGSMSSPDLPPANEKQELGQLGLASTAVMSSISNPNLLSSLANEKQELEQSDLVSAAAMSSTSEDFSQNTAVATPVIGAMVDSHGRIGQESYVVSNPESEISNSANNSNNSTDNKAVVAEKEEYQESMHGDPSAAVAPFPLVNSTLQ
ncbi:hypothetical protein BGZ79_006256 [Entomortierella chlamydospora]|nr:hypothetical protein BGZ79_006256 [Entomortierella chlamydospora]